MTPTAPEQYATQQSRSGWRRFVNGPAGFLLPGLVLYAAFSLYPLVYQFYVALTDMQIATIYQARWVGLSNFAYLAADPVFREVFLFTLAFVVVTVPTQFVLGFGLALLLDQRLTGRLFFRLAIILPIAISPLIVGLMWRLLLHDSGVGLVNAVLVEAGFSPVRWFSSPNTARFSVFLVNLWQSVGGTMLFMLSGLQTIPVDVIESAKVDGASAWQQVVRIKLPMLRQAASLALIFIFLGSFQIFEKILALTNGGPGRATNTIGFRMYVTAFGGDGSSTNGLLGRGAAIGVVMFLFVLAFALLYLQLMLRESQEV